MTDNRKAGYALIVGSVGGLVTMALHFAGNNSQYAVAAATAHALAIISLMLLFLGGLGLASYLHDDKRLAVAGVVAHGVALVAAMIAGSISGFALPVLLGKMSRDLPETQAAWRIVLVSLWQVNQAMSQIYSIAAAGAITLWSASCLRTGKLSRGLAIYGCVTAMMVTVLIAVGHLRLDKHGMTAVMVVEVIWFVGIGLKLLREQ